MNFIDSYIWYNRNHASPELYHRWAAHSLIGAGLSRSVWIGDLRSRPLFPTLYIVLVGPAGLLFKSTCVSEAERVFDGVQPIYAMPSNARRECLAVILKDIQEPPPSEVKHWKDVIRGCEAVFFVDEMASLFGESHIRDDQMMTWFIEWYDSRAPHKTWTYHTLRRYDNPEKLHRLAIHLVAATTPDYIKEKFPRGCTEQGIGSRIIWVNQGPEHIKKLTTSWGWDEREYETLTQRYRLLSEDHRGHGQYTYSEQSQTFLDGWYKDWQDELLAKQSDPLRGFIARKQNHLLKTALIHAASDPDRWGEKVIHEEDFIYAERAIAELSPGLQRLFTEANANPTGQVALEMKQFLKRYFINVTMPGATPKTFTTQNACVLSTFKKHFGQKYGPGLMLKSLSLVEQYNWAYIDSTRRIAVQGKPRPRELIFYNAEDDKEETNGS